MTFRVSLTDLEIRCAIVHYVLERCADKGFTARAGATSTVEICEERDDNNQLKISAHYDVELEA